MISHLSTTALLLHFYKIKSPPPNKKLYMQNRSQSAPLRTRVSRNHGADAGKVLKFGLIIEFFHSPISNLKNKTKTKEQSKQIQNINGNNTGTSVLL